MREIKFRVWDERTKSMLSWDTLLAMTSENLNLVFSEKTLGYTLQQYTGLKDKNGKEIYEGDFVIVDRDDNGGGNHFKPREVHWQPHRSGWNIADMSRKLNRGVLTVVGNIYESPTV